jgi:dihydroorotate dehydrogenase electron transfer subunit
LSAPVRHWAPVVANRRAADETWWLELDSPEISAAARPGQFVMIGFGLANTGAPFLPRPFSVAWRADDGRIGLLVREFGAGTRRLAKLREGDEALLLGPLGTSFRLEGGGPLVCVAGGVGLAPFLFAGSVATAGGRDVRLVYGESAADRVFDTDLIRSLSGVAPDVWTEDGSAGQRGLVLDALDSHVDKDLLACGPTPMLRAVAGLAAESGARLQVSVEEHMGCGIGTCQGCVVMGADGDWRKACTDGPVFDAADLEWKS